MQDPTSAQFKRWFRDSVVTKVNGEPLKVYHGTKADLTNMMDMLGTGISVMEDFTEFRTGVSRLLGVGAYFTSSPETADIYAGGEREFPGGRQMPVYLRIEKPFVIKSMNRELMVNELAERHPDVADELTKLQTDSMYDQEQGEGINAIMRRLGYDGVIVRPDMYEGETRKDPATAETYVVFDPQQVKSFLVTGEQGPTEDVNIDRQSRVNFSIAGMGSVADMLDGKQRMVKMMTAAQFMSLVDVRGVEHERVGKIESRIRSEDPVAPAFLNVKWDEVRKSWSVYGHEGRHRMLASNRIEEGEEFPRFHIHARRSKGQAF